MSLSFSNAAKAKELKKYFAEHGRIYIVVDATNDDVQLPDSLKGDPALRLVLNMRMPQIIHIRDDGVESSFSFSGVSYPCLIPMHTIWAAYLPEGDLEQGIIWDDCVPEMIRAIVKAVRSNMTDAELAADEVQALAAMEELDDQVTDSAEAATEVVSPAITVIDGGGKKDTQPEPIKRKTGHLKVVK